MSHISQKELRLYCFIFLKTSKSLCCLNLIKSGLLIWLSIVVITNYYTCSIFKENSLLSMALCVSSPAMNLTGLKPSRRL